jgi:hypothetical protein
LVATFQSIGRRLERKHNERAWLAWHIAQLTRAKKIPRLDRLLAKQSTARTPQSWQQQMAVMDMWVHRTRRIAAAEKAKARG